MKCSIKLKIMIAVFISLLFVINVGFSNVAKGQRGRCANQIAGCFDGGLLPPCIPSPTTLPVLSYSWSGGYGFQTASSYCGARRCWILFACACGNPLGAGLCDSRGPIGSNSSNSCSRDETKVVK